MKKENYNMGKSEPFFPDFLFKEAVAALLFFFVLMLIVTFTHVPLEPLADPTDATYVPRPEWYFMFLFQVLKYFPGELEAVAVFFAPTIGILLLLFLPFYDTRKERKPAKRPLASATAVLSLVGVVYMTAVAFQTTPAPPPAAASATKLSAAETAGKRIFQDSGCGACHQPGGGSAPELAGIIEKRGDDMVRKYVKNPKDVNAGSIMPGFATLSDEQLDQLIEYMATVK